MHQGGQFEESQRARKCGKWVGWGGLGVKSKKKKSPQEKKM